MTVYNIILGAMNIVVGVLAIGLAIPLVRRVVAPNPWYGVRTVKSMRSDENWYAMNEHGGRRLIAYGVVLTLIGVAALFVTMSSASWLFWVLLMAPVYLLVPVVVQIVQYQARF